jgi:MFS transporter, YNFM family, putative membrane transport protein
MQEVEQKCLLKVNVLLVVMILSLTGLLERCLLFLSIPLTPIISKVFGVSLLNATWLGSAYSFAFATGFLVFGPLSDCFGRKKVLIPGLLILIPITVAVGASSSFPVLISLRTMQGFVAATFSPTAIAYLSEVLPHVARPVGIACVTTAFLLAGIFGQVYASAIVPIYGWRWVFWLLAITYTVAVLILIVQLPSDVTQKTQVSLAKVYKNMAVLLTRPSLLAVFVASFTLLFSFVAMYSGLAPYLQNRYGIDQNQLFFIRLAGVPGMLLSPLSGRFINRWGSKKVVICSLTLAAFGILLEPLSNQLPILIFATAIFVTGIAATPPGFISLVTTLAAEAKGAALAMYTFVLFAGASFAPLVENLTRFAGFPALCIGLAFILLFGASIVKFGVKSNLVKQ